MIEEKRKQLLWQIQELENSTGRKEILKYLNWYKEMCVWNLIKWIWEDFDKKYSIHDVYRRNIEFIDKLSELPTILKDTYKEEKQNIYSDIETI